MIRIRAWFLLFRPWSYTATLAPFLLACACAWHWEVREAMFASAAHVRWTLGLLAGLLFQATVNLLNTWGDERSGVDDVPGAVRTTPQVHDGLVSLRAVLVAACVCAAGASALGVALCFLPDGRLNIPLLAAGFLGFLGATNYSTGVRFKYRGLGVPFVSLLMGPLETVVACLLLDTPAALRHLPHIVFFSLPLAALVGVIMHGNDMRDIPTDRAAGIKTFASLLGPRLALAYYILCHLFPYVFIAVLFALDPTSYYSLALTPEGVLPLPFSLFPLPFLLFPFCNAVGTLRTAVRTYRTDPASPPWRGLERASGGIHFLFAFAYAILFAFTR